MPTGYTCCVVEEPGVTFPEFAMRCARAMGARAMGALVSMREESLDARIPIEFVPDPYYRESLDKAEAKVRELEVMTVEEAARRAQDDFDYARRAYLESIARWKRETAAYEKMIGEVEAWEPPTKDHAGLKEFMLEQLRMSIDDAPSHAWNPERPDTGEEWLADERKRARENVERDRKQWEAVVASAKARTAWVAALRESLGER